MKKQISGDFISDHPFVSIFLGGCLVKAISIFSEKNAKERYELESIERRKQAHRNEFIRKNPMPVPKFIDEFCYFSFGLTAAQTEKSSLKELVKIWNETHPGYWGTTMIICKDTDSEDENFKKMVFHWERSKTYEKLVDQACKNYVRWIDDQLILQGKI